MKSAEEIMEILDAYDLTGSLRDAAELVGCSHHTVARYVAAREAGGLIEIPAARPQLIDEFLAKVEEWVERSHGKVRADIAHEKLLALGYTGSERTTRRAVAKTKDDYKAGRRRVHRPWVTEPGMWVQYDYGDGPVIDGVKTVLFCAWVAWSRFRVVIPLRDKTMPSVFVALDTTFRRVGGVPTYVLTDNEKTVTVEHIAGVPVRNPQMLEFARHYMTSVQTCVPADPATKGGTESTVKIAKADLVPTDANLLDHYDTFADLEAACEAFCEDVNNRVHRVTRRVPAQMLTEEQARLHPIPEHPYTVAFGVTRIVPVNTSMVTYDHAQYSVPHKLATAEGAINLLGKAVWVRTHGTGVDELVIFVYIDPLRGPIEIARHHRTQPGTPAVNDDHFPTASSGSLDRTPRARTVEEAAFLALGDGARLWLTEAAMAGTTKIRVKMNQALDLAKLFDPIEVDWALGHAAVHARFAEADLASIIDRHHDSRGVTVERRADEDRSLTQGTSAWSRLNQQPDQQPEGDEGGVVA